VDRYPDEYSDDPHGDGNENDSTLLWWPIST